MTKLTNTAVVILGMLGGGPKSGYDIKRLVDRSTRFFWSASYGQIYPELRGLERAGLVRGEAFARGARSRTVYELTPEGKAALRAWLTSSGELTHEIRDEGLLKFFFSDLLEPAERLANVAATRERYETLAARLREVAASKTEQPPDEFKSRTARFGVEFYEWMAERWRRIEEELGG